jgi:hypothetical protein
MKQMYRKGKTVVIESLVYDDNLQLKVNSLSLKIDMDVIDERIKKRALVYDTRIFKALEEINED